MKITINQEISQEAIEDLLCSALEGGSNYWYCITDKITPKDKPVLRGSYLHEYPFKGGALMINDSRADDPELKEPVKLDTEAIQKGLQLMAQSSEYSHHWAHFIKGDYDGETADVFLQFCIFGKVIYG